MGKRCTRCEKQKPLSKFYQHTDGRYYSHCRDCHKNQTRKRKQTQSQSQAKGRRAASREVKEAKRRAVLCNGKTCSKCKEPKPATEFYKSTMNSDGFSSHCRHCQKLMTRAWQAKNLDKIREYQGQWRDANREHSRHLGRKSRAFKKYGLSLEEYEKRLGDGRCDICGKPQKKPGLDHCHRTGQLRGVLCHSCNVGIGFFKDDPKLLAAAIAYLKKFNE